MHGRIAAVVLVGMCLLIVLETSAFAADADSSKSAVGTWILNPTKSHFENEPAPKFERLRVTKDDPKAFAWFVAGAGADGRSYHQQYDGPTDGSYNPIKGEGSPITVAYTRANSVINWTIKDQAGRVIETGSGSVSADGRTLTIKGNRKTAQGESNFESVYDRMR